MHFFLSSNGRGLAIRVGKMLLTDLMQTGDKSPDYKHGLLVNICILQKGCDGRVCNTELHNSLRVASILRYQIAAFKRTMRLVRSTFRRITRS